MITSAPTHPRIRHVTCFADLVSTRFAGEVNAICWSRQLAGDFSEIVDKLSPSGDLTTVSRAELLEVPLSEAGVLAREVLLHDWQLLEEHGASPVLNLIRCYARDVDFPFFPTDVYSYHVDRSPIPTDTFLCTYHGAASDILPNEGAEQKILIPEIREELRKLYDGPEEGFDAFLTEYFFDLHYRAAPGARPINLGRGHLWRLAIDHPDAEVAPCVHRAPVEADGRVRLMMIC